jgi:hypothetical protein
MIPWSGKTKPPLRLLLPLTATGGQEGLTMGKVVRFMCKEDQDQLRRTVKMTAMSRLARTYCGIPRGKRDPLERLVRLWPYVPESLKNELRHILAPAFRRKALIVKDEKLMQEVDDYLEAFSNGEV